MYDRELLSQGCKIVLKNLEGQETKKGDPNSGCKYSTQVSTAKFIKESCEKFDESARHSRRGRWAFVRETK